MDDSLAIHSFNRSMGSNDWAGMLISGDMRIVQLKRMVEVAILASKHLECLYQAG